jgi:hypothetical protein
MVDIKNIFKRLIPANEAVLEPIKRFDISPSSKGLYIDTEGVLVTPQSDTIAKKDFKWVRDSYSVVVPGLMEWYERYLQYATNPNDDFDWKGWHRDGILFTKQIYFSLPRFLPMRYVIPAEDHSDTLESFDVSEEKLDSLLSVLSDPSDLREPVIYDIIGVGVKEEDSYIVVRLRIKGKYDNITLYMENDSLELLRDFLEKIAITEYETVSCESRKSNFGMYFYPQTIGDLKHMGQLHIFSERELVFSAYVNSKLLLRSLYRSIMTQLVSMNDADSYESFRSNMLECFIDDETCKNAPLRYSKLGKIIVPAIDNIREHFQSIYDSLIDEDETV